MTDNVFHGKHLLVVDDVGAHDDTVFQLGLVLRELGEELGVALADSVEADGGHLAAVGRQDGVVRIEGAEGVQILPVIGIELALHDLGRGKRGSGRHRSTSPNTMSSEPRMADTSASMWPRFIQSIACRWG